MTHQFMVTQALIALFNSSHVTIGGQECTKKLRSTSRDVQTANETRSTHTQYMLHSNQSIPDQKHCHSRWSPWISSLNSLNPKDMIPSLPSLTMTVPRHQYSFPVEKKSQWKEQLSYTSNMCSVDSDCLHALSAIEIPGSMLSLLENCVDC